MKIDPWGILTPEDYSVPRTAEEFGTWWNSIYAKFGASRERVVYSRDSTGLIKKFYEEAQPMLAFMKAYHSDKPTRCKLLAGNEADDALLIYETVSSPVQIAFGIDGQLERLRSRELTKTGHVNAIGKPTITGSGKSRVVTFPRCNARLHDDLVAEVIANLESTGIKKRDGNFSTGYILIIGFHDRILDKDDTSRFAECHQRLAPHFKELYFVGIHGVVLFPPPCPPQNPTPSTTSKSLRAT
jgi:hypothetical protein